MCAVFSLPLILYTSFVCYGPSPIVRCISLLCHLI